MAVGRSVRQESLRLTYVWLSRRKPIQRGKALIDGSGDRDRGALAVASHCRGLDLREIPCGPGRGRGGCRQQDSTFQSCGRNLHRCTALSYSALSNTVHRDSLALLRRVIGCFDLSASLLSVKLPFETTRGITRAAPWPHRDPAKAENVRVCRIFKTVGRVKRGMKLPTAAARSSARIFQLLPRYTRPTVRRRRGRPCALVPRRCSSLQRRGALDSRNTSGR